MKKNTKRHDLEKPYTPEILAMMLKRSHGIEKAYLLAKENVRNTDPKFYDNLPRGHVFFNKGDGDSWSRNDNQFKRLTNFWTHVFNILRKQHKPIKKDQN